MLIANPIYDVVFKYMMEDAKVAKLFLAAIIGKEIIEIQFLPQELSSLKSSDAEILSLNLSIYRLDFSAKIKDELGNEEVIIIEVQKSKMYSDSIRFRRYLGKQYMNESYFNDYTDRNGRPIQIGIPIYSIYFLGTSMDGFEEHPIVHIKMVTKDHVTGKEIEKEDKFIKSLYHEGTIVNIPALRGKRREELEILLSIFDQENRTADMHIMNVSEQDFPVRFRPIIKRLKQAVEVREVRDVMEIEDDFVKEVNEYENRLLRQTALYEQAQRKQEEAQQKQDEAIILLLENGVSAEKIAAQLNLSLDYILKLQKK